MLFEAHEPLLNRALEALRTREYWSPFPENPSPKVYGEGAQADGKRAITDLISRDFPLRQNNEASRHAGERSPWGVELGIRYPVCRPQHLVDAALNAESAWRRVGPRGRIGILMEALTRLHQRSFEIAEAVRLTTGQGPVMAFQAGGPHAQDRALEALAYAWKAMADTPSEAVWEKPQGKNPPQRLRKHYEIVGRGVALVVGCATFPTWNSYPGLFAALATGNPVIVKPHPNAILPLAITVAVLRDVFAQQGVDPEVVSLAVCPDLADTQALATHPAVASIDFTGGNAFGGWLAEHARQARLYAELAGVNSVLVESANDYQGMLRNLAFSLCLYSGQMCTAPQNIYVPRDGIATDQGHKSFDAVALDLGNAVTDFLSDPKVALTVLGAIGSPDTLARLEDASRHGKTVLQSRQLHHPEHPQAQVRTPAIVGLMQHDQAVFCRECFGPVSYLIATDTRETALDLAASTMRAHGALTFSAYSTDPTFLASVAQAALRCKAMLSVNLTQGLFVNQSAAFSDFHGSGGNPAANTSFTSLAFVADRFVVVGRREHI